MSESKGYQGWTNRETWTLALRIGNDRGLYEMFEVENSENLYAEAVREQLEGLEFSAGEDPVSKVDRDEAVNSATGKLEDMLKDYFTADLLNSALGEVNWGEIAHSYIYDLDKDGIEKEVAEEFKVEVE